MTSTRLLPNHPGPKLRPFTPAGSEHPEIEFLQFLGSGLHSLVYQVRISGAVYALKAFRCSDPFELVPVDWINHGYVDVDTVANENDPFHAECRAYGRLIETNNEYLATKCYGHLTLDNNQEAKLKRLGCTVEIDLRRTDTNTEQPIRCIVKEYLPPAAPFTYNMIPRMRKTIQQLNRLGIIVYDLRAGNYINGRLIDFSQARTTPHFTLNLHSPWLAEEKVREFCMRDLIAFDTMMQLWNKANPRQQYWWRFLPSVTYGRRLRNRAKYNVSIPWKGREGVRIDAILYNCKAVSS